MKLKLLPLILLFCTHYAIGQIQWTKYANNPVLIKGPAFYDLTAVGQPTVLFENDTIKMWYSAVGGDMKSRIGYAWSLDGVNWNKHTDMVLNTGNEGEWDSKWMDTPEIIKLDTCYLLYYYGDSIGYTASLEGVTHSSIGVAYSYDGINWTKSPANPVFTKGNVGDWDGTWIESPAILYNENTNELQMWYNGTDTTTWKIQIGLATSSDGINWTKHASNPVLQNGVLGTYDDMWIGTPAVIYENNHYEMWYSAASSTNYNAITHKFDTLTICFATSSNGINWIKNAANPLFNTFTSPYDSLVDNGGPWAADVIFDGNSNTYKMWYEAEGGFLLATSLNTASIIENNLSNCNELIIYPNPFISNAFIETDHCFKNASLKILNNSGQTVKQINNLNGTTIRIDRNNLPSGIYFYLIEENDKKWNGKLIIK